jgi:diapolycopene oxygenase
VKAHSGLRSGTVAVVGGGLGGLSAAAVLAARGYRVRLFDKNQWLGGKAAQLCQDGFRFDMGPTILTLPEVLARIYAEAGKDLAAELDLIRLDPQWRCFFDDGSVLDLVENEADMVKALGKYTGDVQAGDGYRRFLALSERLHNISKRFFFWRSVEDLRDTLDMSQNFNPSTLADVMTLRMGATVAGTIRRRVKDGRVAQMLDHFTQYVGSSPYGSPAVLCSIAHMQTSGGIWYPRGGTRAVADGLVALGQSLGVIYEAGRAISKIETANGQVTAVVADDGERIDVSAVVSNMDSVRTYRELIGGSAAVSFNKARSYEPACSGVVLYLGLNKRYDHLGHHDFVFSSDPKAEFDAIYRRGEPAPDPTCYLAAPARTDPSVAPPGGEALYVLVHTPYIRPGQDWRQIFPGYRRVILDKLIRTAGLHDLEQRIVFEQALTPQDIHDRYQVLNGAIYGLASHGRFFGAFKPGNRSRHVRGLYLAGGAAHPGPGMPMVMMSGWIAADSLDQDARSNQPVMI